MKPKPLVGAGPECSVLVGGDGGLLVVRLVSLDLSVFHPLVELADDGRGDQGDGKNNNVEQGGHDGSFQEVLLLTIHRVFPARKRNP